jgi:hypothetical protein
MLRFITIEAVEIEAIRSRNVLNGRHTFGSIARTLQHILIFATDRGSHGCCQRAGGVGRIDEHKRLGASRSAREMKTAAVPAVVSELGGLKAISKNLG